MSKLFFLHILLIISDCFLLKFLHIAALTLALALLSSAQQHGWMQVLLQWCSVGKSTLHLKCSRVSQYQATSGETAPSTALWLAYLSGTSLIIFSGAEPLSAFPHQPHYLHSMLTPPLSPPLIKPLLNSLLEEEAQRGASILDLGFKRLFRDLCLREACDRAEWCRKKSGNQWAWVSPSPFFQGQDAISNSIWCGRTHSEGEADGWWQWNLKRWEQQVSARNGRSLVCFIFTWLPPCSTPRCRNTEMFLFFLPFMKVISNIIPLWCDFSIRAALQGEG